LICAQLVRVSIAGHRWLNDFKNGGRELRPKGDPEKVRIYDFEIPELGKVAPYGVYDEARNEGWVNVGTDHDTATFAVESIRKWWMTMGRQAYPEASQLLITADGGGSNGARVRLWKIELQKFANESGLAVSVCHFPPGTRKPQAPSENSYYSWPTPPTPRPKVPNDRHPAHNVPATSPPHGAV
jgi:hypothetical protein